MNSREQVIEQVKKLLAHSVENGATEAEAVAFALKAQKLIADNDLEEWELGESCKQEVVEVTSEKSYARAWRGFLAATVAENFRCKAVQSRRCATSGGKSKTFITFVGYESDARAALMVFEHLYAVGDKLGKLHESRCYTDQNAYENFVRGFVKGVGDELEKQCQALMLVCPRDVENYYNGMSLKSSRRPKAIVGNEHSQDAGRKAGRDAVRSRRVGGGNPAYQLA